MLKLEGGTKASSVHFQPGWQLEAAWSLLQHHCGEIGVVSLSISGRGVV